MDSTSERRKFFKYLLGIGAFGLVSILGFKKGDGFLVGKMKDMHIGPSEADGECGTSFNCSGGGGECGTSFDCSGGGGKCGTSFNCSGT